MQRRERRDVASFGQRCRSGAWSRGHSTCDGVRRVGGCVEAAANGGLCALAKVRWIIGRWCVSSNSDSVVIAPRGLGCHPHSTPAECGCFGPVSPVTLVSSPAIECDLRRDGSHARTA